MSVLDLVRKEFHSDIEAETEEPIFKNNSEIILIRPNETPKIQTKAISYLKDDSGNIVGETDVISDCSMNEELYHNTLQVYYDAIRNLNLENGDIYRTLIYYTDGPHTISKFCDSYEPSESTAELFIQVQQAEFPLQFVQRLWSITQNEIRNDKYGEHILKASYKFSNIERFKIDELTGKLQTKHPRKYSTSTHSTNTLIEDNTSSPIDTQTETEIYETVYNFGESYETDISKETTQSIQESIKELLQNTVTLSGPHKITPQEFTLSNPTDELGLTANLKYNITVPLEQ